VEVPTRSDSPDAKPDAVGTIKRFGPTNGFSHGSTTGIIKTYSRIWCDVDGKYRHPRLHPFSPMPACQNDEMSLMTLFSSHPPELPSLKYTDFTNISTSIRHLCNVYRAFSDDDVDEDAMSILGNRHHFGWSVSE